ncbi:hypothetical protein LTR37_001508 [Vermiconidia calcicola]|uniref:Uncharacterized protein n=1 Tax=Vermiconidia calcicola TaxID=1690605 RepID=A0ACC3NVY2_9PEZI|nr:hypothetical protein LTR37_001508 [Vermiconidia calcicola]
MTTSATTEIAELRAQLAQNNELADKLEEGLDEVGAKNEQIEAAHAICVEQLARAHAHLQNVCLADMDPESYSFDANRISEWLKCLESALPSELYEFIVKRTKELDEKGYGTKDQQEGVSDVGPAGGFESIMFQHS